MFWVKRFSRNNPQPIRRTARWTELYLQNYQSNKSSAPAGLPNTHTGNYFHSCLILLWFWGGSRQSGRVSRSKWSSMRPHFRVRLYETLWNSSLRLNAAGNEKTGFEWGLRVLWLFTNTPWMFFFFAKAVQFLKKKKKALCDYIRTNWVVNKLNSNELDYSQIQTLICLLLNVTKHHVHLLKFQWCPFWTNTAEASHELFEEKIFGCLFNILLLPGY